MLLLRVAILTCTCTLVKSSQDYHKKRYNVMDPKEQPLDRLLKLMQNYMEFGIIRVQEIKQVRWKHEKSLEYELGYLIGDLVERYKRIVDEVRKAYVNIDKQHRSIPNDMFHILVKVENCQKIYFEVYHLVRMIHELPRKWKYKIAEPSTDEDAAFKRMREAYERSIKLAAEQKEKRLAKQRAAQRERVKATRPGWNGTTLAPAEMNSKPYNVWWPYDYGWELDAYGW